VTTTRGWPNALEEFAKKPSCGLFVTLRLDQDVQYIAFAAYSTPQPILLPFNWKDNFVQVPFVRRTRAIPADHEANVGLQGLPFRRRNSGRDRNSSHDPKATVRRK
jgi:hypothetical protein